MRSGCRRMSARGWGCVHKGQGYGTKPHCISQQGWSCSREGFGIIGGELLGNAQVKFRYVLLDGNFWDY